jgi:hypothetical protein
MKLNFLFPLLALVFGSFGCSDNDPKPAQKPQLRFQFTTVKTPGAVNARMAMNNSVTFNTGFITIREIQFEARQGDNDSIATKLEQEVKIDFATGATAPDISALTFEAGTYQEVEVEIELQDKGTQPAIVLEGVYRDGQGLAHPLRFEFNSGETFEVEKEGNITFAHNQGILAQVTFDPTAWFAGVSAEQFALATRNTQGVIVVSATRNTNIYEVVANGLDLATEVEISNK